MEEKTISIPKSLPAKMFYYMAGLAIIVFLGTSYQNHFTFSKHISERAGPELVSRAEIAMSHIESHIENWKTQVSTVVSSYDGDDQAHAAALDSFVGSNADFIAMQVFSSTRDGKSLQLIAKAQTKKTTDIRFEDKTGSTIITASMAEAQRLLPQKIRRLKGRINADIHSLAGRTKLPIMFIVTKHDSLQNDNILWSILINWQTALIKTLPTSSFIDSALIDNKGDIFSSNNLLTMTTKNKFSGEKITKEASSTGKLSAAVREYLSKNGKVVVGGYARSPTYGLAVIVEEDIESAMAEIKHNNSSSIYWSILFILTAGMFAFVSTRSILSRMSELRHAVRRISRDNLNEEIVIPSNDELAMLANEINTMSSAVLALIKAKTDRATTEIQVSTIKAMQTYFLPRKNILAKNLRVAGFYQPSTKCGGDLWGHYELQEDIHLLFVADAMGVGLPAALVTAMTYTVGATISTLTKEKTEHVAHLHNPSNLLSHINGIIWDSFQGSISLTIFCAIIDTKQGKMTYANAGHNFPFVIPTIANDKRSKSRLSVGSENNPHPFSIKLKGNPLGLQKIAHFENKELAIHPGDKIFLFTDGLIECSSPDGEVWGRKHLYDQLSEITTLPFDELKDEILSRAFGFFANKPLEDDVTVVVAEIPKSWKATIYPDKVSRSPIVHIPIPTTLPNAVASLPPPEIDIHVEGNFAIEHAVLQTEYKAPTSSSNLINLIHTEIDMLNFELGMNKEGEVRDDCTITNLPIKAALAKEDRSLDGNLPDAPIDPAQEISTIALEKQIQGPPSANSTPKKISKGKYKVRLPKTG